MASIHGDKDLYEQFNNHQDDEELPGGENDEEQLENADVDGDGAQAIKIEPKKRVARNPRSRLTVEILSGPRGIQTIEDYFKDIKFKGKHYEKHDLDAVMHRMQHWAHRMYPKYRFNDVLTNIERLEKKKPLQVHMSRYRLGLLENIPTINDQVAANVDDNGGNAEEAGDEPFDEFDALLGKQIAISKLAPRTPAQSNRKAPQTPMTSSTMYTPSFARGNMAISTPYVGNNHSFNTSDLVQPLNDSQPLSPTPAPAEATKRQLTAEQLARMSENRRIAQERLRAKRLQQQQQQQQEQRELQTLPEQEGEGESVQSEAQLTENID